MNRVLDLILNQPLMIAPSKLSAILLVLQGRGDLQSISDLPEPTAPALKAGKNGDAYYLGNGVAVMAVHGSLVHRAKGFDAMSGMKSYAELSRDFEELRADNSVRHIVLSMDSHGGHVNGAFDFADEVFAARDSKKITAIVDESAYSAGYLIASAAHEVIVTRTAGVGSVGVITAHVDQSEKNEKDGIKVTALYAGDRKNDMNPNEALSDEARSIIEGNLQNTYNMFTQTVARNRNMTLQQVVDTQAGYYVGEEAITVGFADKIQAAKEALNQIISETIESTPVTGRISRAARAMEIQTK